VELTARQSGKHSTDADGANGANRQAHPTLLEACRDRSDEHWQQRHTVARWALPAGIEATVVHSSSIAMPASEADR
jgi:hypothetical protein